MKKAGVNAADTREESISIPAVWGEILLRDFQRVLETSPEAAVATGRVMVMGAWGGVVGVTEEAGESSI